MGEHFVMVDGGYWNEMEFELYQASCLMEVAVTKERWVTPATRIACIL
jgi:hypothetical protein